MLRTLRTVAAWSAHAAGLSAAVGIAAWVCWLKLSSLTAWRYTSDLFTYDQVLAETLAGHFGLEYTYGNTFGDHAYLFLLVLLPLKLLAGDRMVIALLVIPPLAYLAVAVTAYVWMRREGGTSAGALLGAMLLVFPPGILQALYHHRYGTHPMDELGGFFAVLVALALRTAEATPRDAAAHGTRRLTYYALLACFVSLKEETAILGIVFGLALVAVGRRAWGVRSVLVSAAVLGVQLAVMQASATAFNDRTMGVGALGFVAELREDGLVSLLGLYTSEARRVLLGLGAAFAAGALASGGVDRHGVALLVTGYAKIAAALVVRRDADLDTWHNYPGVVMLCGAVALQMTRPGTARLRTQVLAGLLVAAAATHFVRTQPAFAGIQARSNARDVRLVESYREDLRDVIRRVEAESVVAIPPRTAAEWTLQGHHRYTFYPRGVQWSPLGIADYAVLQRKDVAIRSYYTPPRTRREIERDHPEFFVIHGNESFLLLRRVSWTAEGQRSREAWIEEFGRRSLGRGNRWIDPELLRRRPSADGQRGGPGPAVP